MKGPDVHVLTIKPDLGGEMHDEPDADDSSGDYEKNLADAFEAVKDDDKEGFVKSLKAAIEACMSEQDYEE
jgi:hypothetical protein